MFFYVSSSSYVSRGAMQKQASLEDDPFNGYHPSASADNSVRVSNHTGSFNGSIQNRPDNNDVGCYNIAQFSTPNSSRQMSGFPGLVPLPSSSYGIHRRSRTSAVLLRAQKFESRVQQQQHQQPLNQFQRTLPTRTSNERMGPSSRFVDPRTFCLEIPWHNRKNIFGPRYPLGQWLSSHD